MMQEHFFQRLVRNSAKCKLCLDEIESKHQHDFRYCSCGSIAVDGGLAYTRRVGNLSAYEDTSVYRNLTCDEMLDRLAILNIEKDKYTYSRGYIDNEIQSLKHYLNEWYGK